MSSLSPAIKQEICRLARREIRAQAAPTRQAIVQYRREIAELKRQLRDQQRLLASLQSRQSGNSNSNAGNGILTVHEPWLLQHPEAMAGILEGIRQADRGEFVKDPPDFEADMEKARKALEKFNRKKSKG